MMGKKQERIASPHVTLAWPPRLSLLDRRGLIFCWAPNQKKRAPETSFRYRLRIYDELAGKSSKKVEKRKPVFESEKFSGNIFVFKQNDIPLTAGRLYGWQVETLAEDGTMLASSSIRKFVLRLKEKGLRIVTGPALMRRHEFLPIPLHLFGSPVRLRWRTEAWSPAFPEEEPEDPEAPDIVAVMTWASPAAEVFLVPQLWAACQLTWNYEGIPGCNKVILQIAGESGFANPSDSPDALSDSGVVKAYEGPLRTECVTSLPVLLDLAPLEGVGELKNSLQFNLCDPGIWGDRIEFPARIQLRLVPVDAGGVQVDAASDPVLAVCFNDWPGIELEEVRVTWHWGETPRRDIEFNVRLIGTFPPDAPWPLPVSFVFGCLGSGSLTDVEMRIDDEPAARRTTATVASSDLSYPAYVLEADEWSEERIIRCRWSQEWPLYRGVYGSADLLEFADVRIYMRCYPGIGIDWPYCGGPMAREACHLPEYAPAPECRSQVLAAGGSSQSVWEDLRRFFGSIFAGSRLKIWYREDRWPPEEGDVTDLDLWRVEQTELERVEEIVTVQFTFPGSPADGEAFRASVLRAENPAMSETTEGGTSRHYDFIWYGQRATLVERFGDERRYHGESRYEPGRVVLGLPYSLDMNFRFTQGTGWEVGHAVEEWESIEYRLTQ